MVRKRYEPILVEELVAEDFKKLAKQLNITYTDLLEQMTTNVIRKPRRPNNGNPQTIRW